MKTVPTVYTLLMNTDNLFHISQVAEGTVFMKHAVLECSFNNVKVSNSSRFSRIVQLWFLNELQKYCWFIAKKKLQVLILQNYELVKIFCHTYCKPWHFQFFHSSNHQKREKGIIKNICSNLLNQTKEWTLKWVKADLFNRVIEFYYLNLEFYWKYHVPK